MGIGEFLEVLTRSHWQNENKVAPKQPQPAPLPAGGGSPPAKQVQHGKGADEFWDTIIQLSAYENTLLKGAAQPTTTRSMVSTFSRSSQHYSTSPSGRGHSDPKRRAELHQNTPLFNYSFNAPKGAPEKLKEKESSWLTSQAFFDSLRHYPGGAMETCHQPPCNDPRFSGNTHASRWEPGEHLDTGTRARVGMNAARDGWESAQLHRVWDSKPMERHYQMHQN